MERKFAVWDWIVFAAMLGVSAFIGIYYAYKSHVDSAKNNTGEFLMGGRKLKLIPVSISILVSFMSAITILGAPAEMYTAGTLYFIYIFGLILACILSAQLFVPLLYPLKLTSSFEYIEQRFNSKAAKLTGAIIMIVQQVVYMGIASYAPSTALEAVTGFPTWATIVIVGGVSTFYTFLGGMKAVVWTDVFQSVIMIAGLAAIVIQGFITVGGTEEVWRLNEEWNRIEFWEVSPDPTLRHSVWSLVVGAAVLWMSAFGISQASVQRFCAVPTIRAAKQAVLVNIVGCIILMVFACLAGVVMFAYYAKKGCDPLSAGEVSNSNQLIPYFVLEVLGYPGLPGLFISCLFSGALSTMSSCLNALAAVCWEDMFKPLIGEKVSESTKTWITKILVAVFGGAGVGFAFMAQNLGGTVLQASVSFTGAASGPLLGIFLLGGLFPFANSAGCVTGGLLGLVISTWISVGAYNLPGRGYKLDFPTDSCPADLLNATVSQAFSNATTSSQISGIQHIYTVSYLWFCSIGTAASVIIGIIVSLATMPCYKKREINPKYLVPLFDRLFCCVPEKWRFWCRCGYEFRNPQELVEEQELREIERSAEVKAENVMSSIVTAPKKSSKESNLILNGSQEMIRRKSVDSMNTDTMFQNPAYDLDSKSSVDGHK